MKRQITAALSILVLIGVVGGCGGKDGSRASVRDNRDNNTSSTATVREFDTAQEMKSKMDSENVVVIHALSSEHYAKGHVPGAKNVDYQHMTPEMLPSDKNQTLVFYCGGPTCPVGHNAAKKAAAWGYKDVWVYKGGFSDWKASGMQVDTGAS